MNELLEARDDRTLSKVVARYARVELLILDELVYVPLAAPEAELLFQVLDDRAAVVVKRTRREALVGPDCPIPFRGGRTRRATFGALSVSTPRITARSTAQRTSS